MTGSPLSAAKRLMFSLEVKGIPEVEIMKDLQGERITQIHSILNHVAE